MVLENSYTELPQYAATIVVHILTFTGGNVIGWSSPVGPQLLQGAAGFPVSEDELSWLVSMKSIGAIVASAPFGYLADRFGRKVVLLGTTPLLIIGWCLITWSDSLAMMYAGRFLLGTSYSVGSLVLVYVVEISHKDIRGALASSQTPISKCGILFSYIVGVFCPMFWFNVICAFVPIVFVLTFFIFPETPVHNLCKGHTEEAHKSLTFFRGSKYNLDFELSELAAVSDKINYEEKSKWKALTSKKLLKPLALVCGIKLLQEFSGATTFLAYAEIILQPVDDLLHSGHATIVFGSMPVVFGCLVTFLVDRVGRVSLLVWSSIGAAISNIILGVYFSLRQQGYDVSGLGWLPLVGMCLFMSTYTMGLGPIPQVLIAELLPAQGWDGTFWFYAACCAFAAIVGFFFSARNKNSFVSRNRKNV